MKSAYEIALKKAKNLEDDFQDDTDLEKREEVKPLLAQFFKGKIDADKLWQKLKKQDDHTINMEAQLLLIDSLGLQTTESELKKRKKGILAVETLKETNKSSLLEQILEQITNLCQKYKQEKKKLEEQLEKLREENSEMKMRPVQTQDGQTVMQLESDLDEDTKNHFKQQLNQYDTMYNQNFKKLITSLKEAVK